MILQIRGIAWTGTFSAQASGGRHANARGLVITSSLSMLLTGEAMPLWSRQRTAKCCIFRLWPRVKFETGLKKIHFDGKGGLRKGRRISSFTNACGGFGQHVSDLFFEL
jgi:hypothetical protein